MSSGILSAVISTCFTLKSRFSSLMNAQGGDSSCPRRIIIIGFISPMTGSGLITPTTGFFGRHHARDGARDIVFQQALAIRGEKGNGLLLVEHADAQAEIDSLAAAQVAALRHRRAGPNLPRRNPARDRAVGFRFFPSTPACIRRANPRRVARSWRAQPASPSRPWCSKTGSAPAYRVWPGWPWCRAKGCRLFRR